MEYSQIIRLFFGTTSLLATLLLTVPVEAAEPRSRATLLDSAPVLDGKVLGDGAWRDARALTNFTQVRPTEGAAASKKTEVFIGYTKDALYVGVICYDDDPSAIIVADSRRDSDLDVTDSFSFIIDGFFDRQNGFVFGTNPAGVQYDGQVTNEGSGQFRSGGGGFNLDWDTSWDVQAQITDYGWSAEFELPFKSLRYGNDRSQAWGFNFQRNIRRNNEIAFWAPIPRQYNLYRASLAGRVEGIDPPAQRNLKITPYAVGKMARGGTLIGTSNETDVGMDLKYSITPSLTLDATVNTDFAQVESDEQQVNLDRFSLFFPEKRPFFLENAGQFGVGVPREVELFFSRRIGIGSGGVQQPIDGGVRLSGKIGSATNVGFIQMRTQAVDGAAETDFTVARVNQELRNRSSVGFLIVNRDSDSDNQTYAGDWRWGIGENGRVEGFVAKTDTPGIGDDDTAWRIASSYNSQAWSFSGGYTEVGAGFNPEVGFLARRNYKKADAFALYRYRPEDWWGLHELRPHIAYRGFWDFDGFYETGFLHVDNHWEWRSGLEIHTGVNFTHEGVLDPFEIVDGVTVPAGDYDHKEAQIVFDTDPAAPISFESRTIIGGFFGGERIAFSPGIKYRIGETFSSELSWNHNDIDLPVAGGDFEVNLTRLRLSYSFSPKISIQALVQHNDRDDVVATNLRFAWLQAANAGLYVVYNETDDRLNAPGRPRREFIIKYSRIFDAF